jgi:hypothetical protein
MFSTKNIKRLPDGTIDSRYYTELGRDARAAAFFDLSHRLIVLIVKWVLAVARGNYKTDPSRPSISDPSA